MNEQIFIAGLAKMWWIFLPLILALVGTSIIERRDKHARSKAQRTRKRSKQMQHKF